MLYTDYIKDLSSFTKNTKKYNTIKCPSFKKKVKIFKKKDTMFINPNLKHFFRNCSVKEWLIINSKIENMLWEDDYKLDTSKIVSSLIMSYLVPQTDYLLSSYYHYSSKRIPKIKGKFQDVQFLIKSLILNNDKDKEHLKSIKYKLNHIGISNFKFVFEKNLFEIENENKLDNEENLSDNTKDILKHYLNVNKRKRDFKIFKIRRDFIYDGFMLFFLNINNYELVDVLFYKNNLNYFDYNYEIFVIKKKTSP